MGQDGGESVFLRPEADRDSMMVITSGRIGYLGRIGTHDVRVFGAPTIYVSMRHPFTITHRGATREAYLAVVPAHEAHRVRSSDRYGAQMVIEPETMSDPLPFNMRDMTAQRRFAESILSGFQRVPEGEIGCDVFDRLFFGRPLAPRHLDRRIRTVAEKVRADPAEKHSAEGYALDVGLSVSRFSHLFRAETGSTFRRFCAWKRARGVMTLVGHEDKLVETALSAGYADSTHFSHSVRQFFGIRPRDLVDIMAARGFRMIASAHERPRFAA